uniref:Uncharacterized protein n=1 Tax=Onchocerca volvulus TaxID=6282 RepID=A0A2K6VHW8_ONCVO
MNIQFSIQIRITITTDQILFKHFPQKELKKYNVKLPIHGFIFGKPLKIYICKLTKGRLIITDISLISSAECIVCYGICKAP